MSRSRSILFLFPLFFFIYWKTYSLPKVNFGVMNRHTFQYLAIGDSYTIGEKVSAKENFPNQVSVLLTDDSNELHLERIIAKTGWTTDELEEGIRRSAAEKPLLDSYDLVSLLIGVNNQYRGRSVEEYVPEFQALLNKAIQFAGNRPDHVVVLSIPDWGVTSFAEGRDRKQIAKEIDAFNVANREIAEKYHVHYIDITPLTRQAANDLSLLAEDGLHPSGKEYKRWAEKIAAVFHGKL